MQDKRAAFLKLGVSLLASAFLLSGCASSNLDKSITEKDNLEGVNRFIWGFNQGVDKVAIKPVTTVYRTVTPKPMRRGLSRVIANLNEPFYFFNNLLQGKPKRALRNLGRFVVNTTIGVGGLADNATGLGIAPADEDFGQTLAVWGVKSGSYVVLPLLGPSNVRDGFGSIVGQFANPYRVAFRETNPSLELQAAEMAVEVIDIRSQLMDSGADSFLKTSLDPYAAAQSAYWQSRKAAIMDSTGMDITPDTEVDGDIGVVPDDAVSGGAEMAPVVAPVGEAVENQDVPPAAATADSPASPAVNPEKADVSANR